MIDQIPRSTRQTRPPKRTEDCRQEWAWIAFTTPGLATAITKEYAGWLMVILGTLPEVL